MRARSTSFPAEDRPAMTLAALLVVLLGLTLAACAPATAPPAPRPDAPRPEAPGSPEAPAAPAEPGAAWPLPVRLAAPPWAEARPDPVARRAVVVPVPVEVESAPNEITDEEAWLARHGFARPGDLAAATRDLPFTFGGGTLVRVIEQPDVTLALYAVEPGVAQVLLAVDDDGPRFAYDFEAYVRAPAVEPGDEGFVAQGLAWAALAGGVLYVQHHHMTYAASSGGQNGYLTALDATTGRLRWRSRPLVGNARTFAVVGDALLTGYGFTAEPDFLYVLDRYTGAVLGEHRVASAPEWLLVRDGRLYLRAYNRDYVFALR